MKCIKCGYEILEQDNERMNKCPVCDTDFLDTYVYIYLKNSSDIKTQNEAFRRIYRNTWQWVKGLVKERMDTYDHPGDFEDEVQDLMNDIYIKAIKNFRCYNPKKGGFRTWFDQMVLNHLHEQIQD